MKRGKKSPVKGPRTEVDGSAHGIRLPGFLIEEEIGLGEVIKRVTHAIGIKTCGGCEQRATTLNRWLRFAP
jgi:hypothetical protein